MPDPITPADALGLARRVERLTAAVAVLSVGLALAVLWHFVPRAELGATRFVVRDARGTSRGALELDPSGNPVLRLNDPNGRARVYGVVSADGTARFRLADTTGASRAVIEVGADRVPHAWLLDSHGRTGLHARVAVEDRPIVDLRWGASWQQITLPDSTGGPATRSPRDAGSRGP